RLADIIYDENLRLGEHIERVLNVAKIDKGELELEKEPININDLMYGVVDSMDLQLKKKEVDVELNLQAEEPIILGDELHLSNVIFNLLDNAIKYSKEDPRIEIDTWSKNDLVHISIRDNGIGMSKEQLA